VLRLRQLALVAHDLDRVVASWRAALGLEVAHRDPAVAAFGLQNAVMPIGDQFVEVVAPTRPGTAAGRHLDRRGGDGGYMVILQADRHDEWRRHIDELGVRVAFAHDSEQYHLMQLHPGATGGSFLEIDEQVGGDDLDGPWEPAGPQWQRARHTSVVDAVVAAELESHAPGELAERWAQILQRRTEAHGDQWEIELDGAVLRFVHSRDGRGDGLAGIDLRAATRHGGARSLDLAGGVRVRVV
jgi:hypothetical protein